MLIVFGGLPGVGKTTIAKTLARKLAAVYLRIDTLEQAFNASGASRSEIGPAGYLAGYAVADDNLRLGLTVVADSVNSLNVTRRAWRTVALEAGVRIVEIELSWGTPENHATGSTTAWVPENSLPRIDFRLSASGSPRPTGALRPHRLNRRQSDDDKSIGGVKVPSYFALRI
jgi:predicted kinase